VKLKGKIKQIVKEKCRIISTNCTGCGKCRISSISFFVKKSVFPQIWRATENDSEDCPRMGLHIFLSIHTEYMYIFNYKISSKYRNLTAKFILNTPHDKWTHTFILGGLRKTKKSLSPTNWFCGRKLNPRPSGYGTEILPPSTTFSIIVLFFIFYH